jgi:membrane carboxypeptidase/penicillin-binding protein PbpC
LLHRAALLVAQRYPPGDLPTPAQVGANPVRVCRLSGLRAGPDCPPMTEWFIPGTEPARDCDWHQSRRVVLPAEYAEWAHAPAARAEGRMAPAPLRILSPRDGDRYALPIGVDPRFATIGLRATGGDGTAVRWFVDGREWREPRWRLVPGPHTIRAVTARGESDEVRIEVR